MRGWKNIEDASASGELSALGHHVDALVGHFDQFEGELRQPIVAAFLEPQGRVIAEVRNNRLKNRSHRSEHDDGVRRRSIRD